MIQGTMRAVIIRTLALAILAGALPSYAEDDCYEQLLASQDQSYLESATSNYAGNAAVALAEAGDPAAIPALMRATILHPRWLAHDRLHPTGSHRTGALREQEESWTTIQVLRRPGCQSADNSASTASRNARPAAACRASASSLSQIASVSSGRPDPRIRSRSSAT